jgi:putative ABC transport system permease protein
MLLLSLRQSWREAKAGPLAGIFWALVITIAVLTAVNTASDRARQALSMTASELLAADLVLSSRQPLAADYQQQAQAVGLATANTVTFNTVVFADTASSLVAAKAVSPEYPLRGSLRAARQRYSMGETTASGPANGEVWAEQRLFEQLNVDIGSMLQVGDQHYRLSQVLTLEPDRSGGFAGLSPRLLLSMDDARQAGLLRSQSRATWRLLLAGDKQVLRDLAEAVRKDPAISVSTPERAQAQSADAIAQTRTFLSIAALSAVFLGAAGMLLAMHQYRLRERQNVALWRSFGIAWPRIRLLMILRLFWLTMVAAVLGVLAGLLLQGVLSAQLAALLQINLPATDPVASADPAAVAALDVSCGSSFAVVTGSTAAQRRSSLATGHLQPATTPPWQCLAHGCDQSGAAGIVTAGLVAQRHAGSMAGRTATGHTESFHDQYPASAKTGSTAVAC